MIREMRARQLAVKYWVSGNETRSEETACTKISFDLGPSASASCLKSNIPENVAVIIPENNVESRGSTFNTG